MSEREPGSSLRSVGAKLAAVMVLIVLVVTVLAAFGLARRERAGLMERKKQGAEMVLKLFSLSVGPALEFEDELALEEAVDRLTRDPEVLQVAVWGAGEQPEPLVHYTSSGEPVSLERPVDPAMIQARHGDTLVLWGPVEGPTDEPLGIVMVEYSLESEAEAFIESRSLIIGSSILISGVMLVLLLGAVRRVVVRPLSRLESAAADLAEGRRSEVQVGARDEVGQLAERFNWMSAAIRDRERRLEAAHEELAGLFDNMRQAIVTVGPELEIEGRHSAAATKVFGRAKLEGVTLRELLLDGLDESSPIHQSFSMWLDMVFEFGPEQWAEALPLAPEELVLNVGEENEQALRLEFRPFFELGKLRRLMILATDETEQRRIERHAREQQSKHDREMAAMRKIVAAGTQSFTAFLRNSEQRWKRIESIVPLDPNEVEVAKLEEMFRHAHTVKGEARTFALGELADAAARVEDTLSRMRRPRSLNREIPRERAEELRTTLAEAREALAAARDRLVEASPLGEEVLDQVMVANGDLAAVLRLSRGASPELRRAAERLAARPLAECAAGLEQAVPTWSEAMGKSARLRLVGPTVRVPDGLAQRLRGILTHLLRNAVAHGIESPDQRVAAGKPERGLIEIEATRVTEGVELRVRDDGRGIDHEALRSGAAREGVHAADSSDAMFRPGVSSSAKIDDLAGHGMGLSAVREELAEVGYTIAIEPGEGPGTCFRIAPERPGFSSPARAG